MFSNLIGFGIVGIACGLVFLLAPALVLEGIRHGSGILGGSSRASKPETDLPSVRFVGVFFVVVGGALVVAAFFSLGAS